MIQLISGASHCGKTYFAQKLLEKKHIPYLSIDHLKMGLIRSKTIQLTPYEDDKITEVLWPILVEIIKTAIENKQNLIIEGCYIPFEWKKDFSEEYLKEIRYLCLIFSESYIENNFDKILHYENVIENRIESEINKETLIKENQMYLKKCIEHQLEYLLDYDFKEEL